MNTATRCLMAIGFGLLLPSVSLAQAYPAKPVRFIIPFPPGGPTDLMGRIAAERLTRAWGVQVVADNRAGAGGNIGFEQCAKSPPDGYTLCMMTVAQSISPSVYQKLGYDPLKDFAHVTLMAILPSLLTVHPTLPVKNVTELLALAKRQPGQLIYSSTGNGTSPHMLMEMFKWMAGLDLVHVPYKGQAPSALDQMSGQVQVAFNTAVTIIPHVKAGKLRPLAISTKERFPPMPELPTVDEGGVKGFDGSSWQAVVMPAGTPREIVAKVSDAVMAAMRRPEFREQLVNAGAEPDPRPSTEFQSFALAEKVRWEKVVKAAGVSVNE